MSLAAETREAVRNRPFLLDALRAGVLNYAAAARALDVSADTDAVATALRRFADDLSAVDTGSGDARVTMHGGLAATHEGDDAMVQVGERAYAADDGDLTGVIATGDLGARTLELALGLLRAHDVDVDAAGFAGNALFLVVGRRDGAVAVRLVERALDGVPTV